MPKDTDLMGNLTIKQLKRNRKTSYTIALGVFSVLYFSKAKICSYFYI